ncbi:ADP-ribosylation factor 8 [Fusarium beomiforme]|uniref:ADP-ribosylation factor 8 n=1 Tax=Fusarium beomiforme TaxID=44412 RepID=A0A9P5DT93_9HYPO|nr:ADP-ribosylation factor 8 [Fusarium beomiforme]
MRSHHGHQGNENGDGGPEFSLEQKPVSPQLPHSAARSRTSPSGSSIPRTFRPSNGAERSQSPDPPDDIAPDMNYFTGGNTPSALEGKRTVHVKRGNKLRRLFGVERTSLHDLRVTVVEEFSDEEAESQYEKYIDFLRNAPPEKHPLGYFRKINRALKPDRALASTVAESSQVPVPFIQFTGLHDEGEVILLHAALFRIKYSPPMPVCYVIQQIRFLAAEGSEVETLNVSPGTLCGALVAIGTGHNRQIATIGGVIEGSGEYMALTTSHHSNDSGDASARIKSFFSMRGVKLDEDEYEDDVPSPLVVDTVNTPKGSTEPLADSKLASSMTSDRSEAGPLGRVLHTGTDWALLRLTDQLVPPNCIDERLTKLGEQSLEDILNEVVFLSRPAPEPEVCEVLVSGGRGGLNKLDLTKKPADLMLPSGVWIRPWKAKHKPDSGCKLQHGDSGAWAVSIDTRTVYGHVMAVTRDHVFIQPLVDIFQDIRTQENIDVKLASPFGQLANLAKHYYFRDEHHLAVSLARKALEPEVISQSTEGPQVSAMLQGFMKDVKKGEKYLPRYTKDHLADFLANLIMCTGRNIDLINPPTWTDDWTAMFGTPLHVMERVNYLKGAGGLPTLNEIAAASSRKTVSHTDVLDTGARGRNPIAQRLRENRPPRPPSQVVKRAYNWASRLFNRDEMHFTMVGLPGCGKSDLLRSITRDGSTTGSISTIGFNTVRIKRRGISAKIWDLAEDSTWRPNWKRYSRGANGIIYVVSARNTDLLPEVHEQILLLITEPMLAGIPLIVLWNNFGTTSELAMEELRKRLDFDSSRRVDFWVGDKATFGTFLDFLVDRRNQ